MKVLMVGVDKSTGGGMWTVAQNYLNDKNFCRITELKYIPTSITGGIAERLMFTFKAYVRIFMQLITVEYDIVHIHMSEKGSVFRKSIVAAMARFFRCRVILHLHGAEFEQWYGRSSEKVQAYVRGVLRKADRIIILGEYWKQFISSLTDGHTPIDVVYNAVAVSETIHYNPDGKVLLFLGAAIERKGINDLLAAVKKIDGSLAPEICLWICGPDPQGDIREKIHGLGLEKRVQYKGYLTEKKKPEVFANTMVNILPSKNEGLPMTILETMAEGIPNITTNIAAIPEAVNSANGDLVMPGDIDELTAAILKITQDREMRIGKSQMAYKTVKEKFSLQGHFQKILMIYKELEY